MEYLLYDVSWYIELMGAKAHIRLHFNQRNVMNVHDHLKTLPVDEIKAGYVKNALNAAVGMSHLSGDFNLGNVIRSANFFGFGEVFYIGGKKGFDRRSTVGTHHYIPLNFFRTEEDFLESIKDKYSLVCVENNIPKYSWKTISIFDKDAFQELIHPPLFLFGEEQLGIPESLLNEAGYILTIPAFGSVRSMNVGSCASVVMAMYRQNSGVSP